MPVLECPICRRKVCYTSLSEVPYRPFCGQRCQRIDLGRWFDEVYRVSEEAPEFSGDGDKGGGATNESDPDESCLPNGDSGAHKS